MSDNGLMSMEGGRRFYKKHKKQLRVRNNMQKFVGGFLQEAMSDGEVVTTVTTDSPPVVLEPSSMQGGMKRAAMKRAAMKRAAMKKKTGGDGPDVLDVPNVEVVSQSQQDGGKKRTLKKRTLKKRTPKYRKTGGEGDGEVIAPVSAQSVRSFLNQLSSGGGKKKVALPVRRRAASPARRRAASPVRRRRRSASPVRRRSLF